jgi:RHS repeat-associated protein
MKSFFFILVSIIFINFMTLSVLQGQDIPGPSMNKNYVRVERPLVEIKTIDNMALMPAAQKSSMVEYYDELGRLIQRTEARKSPAMNDLISITQYDLYGREPLQFLPFTADAKSKFRTDPVSEQLAFYQNTAAVVRDKEPYSKIYFDNSPLNTIRKSYGVGWSWHNEPESRPEFSSTGANTSGEVVLIQQADGALPYSMRGAYVAPNTLTVTQTKDESGLITRIYKNFRDQVILRRTGDGTIWHDTYSMYDTQGNLTCIFPPEATVRLAEYSAGSEKEKFLATWCFTFFYDEFNRMIGKRVPGGPLISMIYDVYDRLILRQDGNQRINNQWTFTKYDMFNRPVMTGFVYGSETSLRSGAKNSTVHHENRLNNPVGYTNLTFPAYAVQDLLTINYYDDYVFLNYTDWDTEKKSYGFVDEPGITDPTKIFLTGVKGYLTGSKVRVVNQNVWLNSAFYYDYQYRLVQSVVENHLNGTDRTSTAYHQFHGKRLKARRSHNSSIANLITQEEFTYDEAQRLVTVRHTIDNGPTVLSTSNRYNELGQLIEQNVHSVDDGKTFLQSIDRRYNIHGWLTHLNNSTLTNDAVNNDDANDLFGYEIRFDQPVEIGSPGVLTPRRFDGSMSSVSWKTDVKDMSKAPIEQVYGYRYDSFNRYLQSRYATRIGTTLTGNAGMFDETINHFDKNGNVGGASATVGLTRNASVAESKTIIDDLTFRYSGNSLRHVADGASGILGFVDKTATPSTVDDYRYDANGNMVEDFNKLITRIAYNHLNLPTEIQVSRTDLNPTRTERVLFTYDANGVCLTKQIDIAGSTVWTQHNVNGVQYDNGRISSVNAPEGRAVQVEPGKFEYEYFYRDAQRNTRVVYGVTKETKRYVATMEPARDTQERTVFGFRNILETRVQEGNASKPDEVVPLPAYAARCNGYDQRPIGPAKIIKVSPGDAVYMEALARYNQVATTPGTIATGIMATALTTAFGITQLENPTLWQQMTSKGPIAAATVPANTTVPKAYLAFLFFDDNNQFQRSGAIGITTDAYRATQKLTRSFTADKSGNLYVYVVNETNTDPLLNVYFDDITIVHQKNNSILQVFQAADYYPYGLRFNEYSSERLFSVNSSDGPVYQPMIHNRCLFQQQELLSDLDLNLYHYKYRMHDPAIGRFISVDPLATDYPQYSPYAFSGNAVTAGVELEGLEPAFIFRIVKFVSPVAVNVSYAKTTHGTNIGFNISYGVPQFLPFSYRKSAGITYHSEHSLTRGSFTENRSGKEMTYFGFLGVEETNYSGGGIDQATGRVSIGNPMANVTYENDWFPDWSSSVTNPFGAFRKNLGDGGDRWRTAALQLNLGLASSGFRLGTGAPKPGQVDAIGGKAGTYKLFQTYNPNQYRLGLAYTSFGNLTIGMNSEKIRNQIQNIWVHDFLNPPSPWFQVLPQNDELYLGLTSGPQW